MERLNLDKNNLRKFGITMGLVFLTLAIFIFLRHKHSMLPLSIISLLFFTLAFLKPALLKLIYILWMKLAFILGWINTRVVLFIIFYFIFTPLGLSIKLFNIDLLDRKIDRNKESYWIKKSKRDFNPSIYERQF